MTEQSGRTVEQWMIDAMRRAEKRLEVVVTRQRRASELLVEAADMLERDGWTQGIGRDPWGARCVSAAIRDVMDAAGLLMNDIIGEIAAEAILVQLQLEPQSRHPGSPLLDQLPVVNDRLGMTAERMIGTMRLAARRLVEDRS